MKLITLVARASGAVMSRGRNLWFRALGVRIKGYVWIRRVSIPRNWHDITLHGTVALDDGVVLLCSGAPQDDKIVIHSGTYINRYSMLDAHHKIIVGENCLIGPYCYITDANHGVEPGVAPTSQECHVEPVILEDEVWLGAKVTVLPGVRIGRGAVIGAGAVVTSDIPNHAIAVGVPARVVGNRLVQE
jgi:acetyltransferase-like isoleucine patch superfamily enzyme